MLFEGLKRAYEQAKEDEECKQTFFFVNRPLMISCIFWFILIYLGDDSDEDEDDEDDADQNILSSDEDEIDEESAMYLESLQDKLNKSTNGNISVSFWKLNDFANFFFLQNFHEKFSFIF